METISVLVIPVLAALLLIGLKYIASWAFNKFSVSIDVQIRALEIIKLAVTRVEEIALASASKIPSPEKLKTALAMVDKLAAENPEVMKYLKGKQTELIEKVLKSSITEPGLTPKAVITAELDAEGKVETKVEIK